MRQEASSDPVPTHVPEGKNSTALTSLLWPVNVLTHALARMSHTFTVESQEPLANMLRSVGCSATLQAGSQSTEAAREGKQSSRKRQRE